MRRNRASLAAGGWVLVTAALACGSSDSAPPRSQPAPGDAGSDVEPLASLAAPKEFDRFCAGRTLEATKTPATPGKLAGKYVGVLKGPDAKTAWRAGVQEVVKVIPEHPFVATRLRANLVGNGQARLRVVTTFGRSYPGSYPSADPKTLPDMVLPVDLVEPIAVDVTDGKADAWIEVDIPPTFLLPTQHYDIVYEHVAGEPWLALSEKTADDVDRSALFQPPKKDQFGVPGNYRLELVGHYFCAIADMDRAFAPKTNALSALTSSFVTLRDLNGDGHDDAFAIVDGASKLFLGDGKGAFTDVGFDPFPDVKKPHSVAFGDLDNDGKQDAFVSVYVQSDGDGDGYTVTQGDCNDADDKVHPNAAETKNGKDDDCDGKVDDGTDASDGDGDGVTVAAGDCDDTNKAVFPGAPELLDARDNDCNGKTDETFVSRVALGDGKGRFTRVFSKDVEILAPSTAIAMGDGNLDGKLDIFAGSWLVHYPDFPTVKSRYYQGDGKGGFVDVLEAAGMALDPPRPVYGAMWGDWNDDGLPDLYVSHYNLRDNALFQNLGGGKFVDVAAKVGAHHDAIPTTAPQYPGGHSYGSDIGDFDNDGDMDIFVPNISHPRTQPWADPSMLLVNQGGPGFLFKNLRREMGIIFDEGDVNSLWVDYDNDSDLDLVVAPTYPAHYTKLYRNDGQAGFVDVTYEARIAVHMGAYVAAADIDEDGDMDLVIMGNPPSPSVNVFENRIGSKNAWVFFDLEGVKCNRDAVGAKVVVKAGGVTQTREVKGGGGGTPSHGNSHFLHFGLGRATQIESVTVRWPAGATETFTGATVGRRSRLVEGAGKAAPR